MELVESSELRNADTRASSRARWRIGIALGALAFGGAMLITSGAGPGLDPDALAYIGAASSFGHHATLRVPSSSWDATDSTAALSVWPPGFPIAMAIPVAMGFSPITSARIVIAIAAFITICFAFVLLDEVVGTGVAAAGTVALMLTPAIVSVHLSVLSEPLFLAAIMLTLFAMTRARPRPVVSGIPAGIAAIVRYAGVFAPIAVAIWFFTRGPKSMRPRITDALLALIAPVLIMSAWVIRTARLPDAQGGMEVSVYGKLWPTIQEGLHTLADWLVPGAESAVIQTLIAIALAAAIVGLFIRSSRNRWNAHAQAIALMLACYLAVLLGARTFVGDAIPFDFRLLAPAILLLEMLIAVCVVPALKISRSARMAIATVFTVWVAGSAVKTATLSYDAVTNGFDFASSEWRRSPTISWIRANARAFTLFTNWPAVIYFRTGRPVHDIPQSLDPNELDEFRGVLADENGVFVAFSEYNTDYPPSDSIAHKAGLVQIEKFADGTIWAAPKAP